MLFGLFCKKNSLTDADKIKFADAIAGMLEVQKAVAGGSMDDEEGNPKRKALGYVYGYVDAALRSRGYDMADMSIGVPITYQVIRRLWPDDVERYVDFIIKNLSIDPLMSAGIMHGGQQFIDYAKPDAPGIAMGLARFMSERKAATVPTPEGSTPSSDKLRETP